MPASLTRFVGPRPKRVVSLNLLALASILGVGYLLIRYGNNSGFSAARVPKLGGSSVEIVPGIDILGVLKPSAVYVIETSDGLVLVDSGLDADAASLKSEMAKLGLDWTRLRAILLTHVHGDHTCGADALRSATGAKVYAGAGDAPVLKSGQPTEAFYGTYFMPNHRPHPTTVDVALKGGETIAFGDTRIRALATPGHSPGSICYLLERKDLSALFAGDVIMMLKGDEHPRNELGKPLGTYSAYLSPRYRGDAKDSLASLRRLRSMPVPDLVLPGHPAADVTPQSPCLTQERWESLLDQGIRDMETLVARYQADGADFLDGVPKPLLPDLYYLGDFRGVAVYGFFAKSKFFVVDAPGGAGLVEFLNTSLRRLGREPVAPAAVLLTACGAVETAGLKELVEMCHTQVVASAEGLESLKASCPPGTIFLSADELPDKHWFDVKPIPVQGRGSAPVAYQVDWAGKLVLFSGRIPAKINPKSAEALIADLSNSRDDLRDYFRSLNRLLPIKPDLWLPLIPIDDQNANLYDTDWQREITENLVVIQLILANAPKR
jgi:glyoxylase-like metal-dependent hydrolase (beta-lactamase superfamily II)